MKVRTSTIELEPLAPNLISITIESKEVSTTHSLPIKTAKKLKDELSAQLKNL